MQIRKLTEEERRQKNQSLSDLYAENRLLKAKLTSVRGLLQHYGGHLLECPAHPFRIQFGREGGACNCDWITSKPSGDEEC